MLAFVFRIPGAKKGDPMKISMLLALFVVVGCVLATGCIAQTKKDVNTSNISPSYTLTSFVNSTMNSTNMTNGNTTMNGTSLQGPLRVSITGYPVSLPVLIDNKTAGNTTVEKPLDLMLDEGLHTVMVCVGPICERENVTITFAKKSFVDFGEALKRDIEFPLPTVRMTQFNSVGDALMVSLEFINPTQKEISMSAEVSVGYTYIEPRSGVRNGNSAQGKAMRTLKAGERYNYQLELHFVNGYAYNYDEPQISNIQYR